MNAKSAFRLNIRAAALVVASCFFLTPGMAGAAGLGKITVLSGLGQPLKAEVEINASREELAGMAVRLASQDSFRQAGIEYAPVLSDLRLNLDKRPNGKTVVRVSSTKVVNEPFLDFLVELSWPAGRLVNEYTFLLDPPDVAVRSAGQAVAVVEAKTLVAIQGESGTAASAGKENAAEAKGAVKAARPAAVAVSGGEQRSSESASTHVVKAGETLRRIASENLYEGVTLEQMLVGLHRANAEAFLGGNINRLKAGAILSIPDKAEVAAVSDVEAKKIYRAQLGDWNSYRQKLAAAAAKGPAVDNGANQSASGKINARVEETAKSAEEQKDKVKISRNEMAPSANAKPMDETAIAREKTLKDAQERVAHLEKNVSDLQKLVQMKNQSLAEVQRQLDPAKGGEQKPALPATKPVDGAVAAAPRSEAARPVDAPKPPVPPKPVLPPEPEPEPGLVDELMEDPLPLVGGGGVLALLACFLVFKRRNAKKDTSLNREEPGLSGPTTHAPKASAV